MGKNSTPLPERNALSHARRIPLRRFPQPFLKGQGGGGPLAERLRADGVRVPKAEGKRQKDEIELHPSSLLLHPLPSAPLNKERRFLPLRLDDAPVNGSPDSLN